MEGSLLCVSLSLSGENHLIIHDEGWPVHAHSHIALAKKKKNVFHNITQFTVLCE